MYRVALGGALRTTPTATTRHAATKSLARPHSRALACPRSLATNLGRTSRRHYFATSTSVSAAAAEQQNAAARRHDNIILLRSSTMFFRRGTLALLSTLAGFGAWYAYGSMESSSSLRASTVSHSGSAATTRKVLVLGHNGLQTGTFVGDGPITKTTADGRRVVEMMTPEQATKALRRGEESVYVRRGEGVVRYDVVQLPSNDPIEDDHAEQVMQVLGSNKELSDWMFWGVFDGHRYVHDLA